MTETKVYKIQDKTTGLYSCGGSYPRFSKTGKAWTNIGHLKNHFRQLEEDRKGFYDTNCQIVEFIVSTERGAVQSVSDFLKEWRRQTVKKALESKEEWEK